MLDGLPDVDDDGRRCAAAPDAPAALRRVQQGFTGLLLCARRVTGTGNLLLVTKLNKTARVNVLVRLADGAQLHSGDDGGVLKYLKLVAFRALAASIETAELLGTQINPL